jgi:hypothetical protein
MPALENIEWEYEPDERLNIPVFTKKLNDAMLQAHEYLGRTYVSQLRTNYELGYRHLWERTADPVHEWHNDLIEGCNLFFLCYLTDVYEGGELCFRSKGIETGQVQPRKGIVVMASQHTHYQHKVNPHPESEKRMLCNFGFDVKDF